MSQTLSMRNAAALPILNLPHKSSAVVPAIAVDSNPAAVLTRALIRASTNLSLKTAELAAILGLSIKSASDLQVRIVFLDPAETETWARALTLVRFTEALGLLLPVEDLPVWLRSENTGLKGTPAALIASSDAGLTEALAYVASHLRT